MQKNKEKIIEVKEQKSTEETTLNSGYEPLYDLNFFDLLLKIILPYNIYILYNFRYYIFY